MSRHKSIFIKLTYLPQILSSQFLPKSLKLALSWSWRLSSGMLSAWGRTFVWVRCRVYSTRKWTYISIVFILVGRARREVKKPSYIFESEYKKFNIMTFKIFDKIMQARNDFFSINNLKLSKFAQVLPIPIFLISDKKGKSCIFSLLFILEEKTLIDHFTHIFKWLINNSSNPTKIRCHKIILFTIFKNIFYEKLSVSFVVYCWELFWQNVWISQVFAFL